MRTDTDNQTEKENDSLGRFEILAERYMNGSKEERDIILSFFPDPADRKALMEGFGLYHLFCDQRFYDAVKESIGQHLYKDTHPEMED